MYVFLKNPVTKRYFMSEVINANLPVHNNVSTAIDPEDSDKPSPSSSEDSHLTVHCQ